ncbi:MAG: glycoside hydrolase family 99-like domain-containing protein [Puia sp.]
MPYKNIKAIAIHLPQFHPIPENDEWWGKGFTEWTNVVKARSFFKTHYQPHLPSDLGFYDLRLREVHEAQASLAKEYGIDGFAYYHYWFHGKKLLEKPVEAMIESKKPDFPFCLIWANETWSRRWLGEEKEILIKQEYSYEDDVNHALYLANIFKDSRYIKVDGRPLFIIYRPDHLPDISQTLKTFKKTVFDSIGVEPYILANNANYLRNEKILTNQGFDGFFSFRPQLGVFPWAFNDSFIFKRLYKNLRKYKVNSGRFKIFDYQEALLLMEKLEPESFENTIPSVFVGFDNTARRGKKGIIIKENSAKLFREELERVSDKLNKSENNLGFVFINAWNEWAEANYLEPSVKFGRSFLEAVKDVFGETK